MQTYEKSDSAVILIAEVCPDVSPVVSSFGSVQTSAPPFWIAEPYTV